MPITASQLYRDSFNFLRNQIAAIVLLALFTAFLTVMLKLVMSPDAAQMALLTTAQNEFIASGGHGLQDMVQQMTPEQQMVLLRESAAVTFSELIGNVLLIGGMLTLIRLVSEGKRVSALIAIGASAPALPRLLLLMFIYIMMVQIGVMLFIVPGVVIAIALSLAPVMVVNDRIGVFAAMKGSCRLVFANARIVVPAMFLWVAVKLLVLILASKLPLISNVTATPIILNALSNLMSALLMIYLFRLYMLVRNGAQSA